MSSTNRGATRNERDFYATPASAVHALLNRVGDDLADCGSSWLEPAVGDGAILRAVRDHKIFSYAHSLPYWHTGDIHRLKESFLIDNQRTGFRSFECGDYLKSTPKPIYDVIITNPPFLLAQEFIEHALHTDYHDPVVIMLLRLGILESKKRSAWWQGKEPDAVYVLSERPDFTGGGGDSCAYGWFFWNWHHKGIFVLPPVDE